MMFAKIKVYGKFWDVGAKEVLYHCYGGKWYENWEWDAIVWRVDDVDRCVRRV